MDGHPPGGDDLLGDAVGTAASRLRTGQHVVPCVITDRWGDRQAEHFGRDELTDAKTRFRDLARTAAGGESYALVYLSRGGAGDDAIVIERARAGQGEPELFVQHFRPRRGRLRGFTLVGEPRSVGMGEFLA